MQAQADFGRFQAAIAQHLGDVAGLRACHAFSRHPGTAATWSEIARIGPVDETQIEPILKAFDAAAGGAVAPISGGWLASYSCAAPGLELCLLFYLGEMAPDQLKTQLIALEAKVGWLLVAALEQQEGQRQDLALSTDIGAAVLIEAALAVTKSEMADQWVARLEKAFSPDLVAVLWTDTDRPRMAAQSGGGQVERPSQAIHHLQDIAKMTIQLRAPVSFDRAQAASDAPLLPHVQGLGAQKMLSLPIYVGDPCRAVVILLWNSPDQALPDTVAADTIAQVLAQALAIQDRAFPNLLARTRNWLRKILRAIFGRRGAKIKLFAAAAALLVLILAFVPMQDRPAFEARIEARDRFVVSAPFDGFLAQAPYQLGDAVAAGATVLALDDADFRLQYARTLAEVQRLEAEIQTARAQRDTAKVQGLDAQRQQAQVQADLLSHQLAQTQLLAARDGVVVGGDAWRRVGGRVRLGEPLLEVADPSSYGVAAYIDESWVADLAAQSAQGDAGDLAISGALLLSSYPDRPIPIMLTQITAAATNRGGVNTFTAWAKVAGDVNLPLLEGMRGIVRLDAGRSTVLKVYTRGLQRWWQKSVWRWS